MGPRTEEVKWRVCRPFAWAGGARAGAREGRSSGCSSYHLPSLRRFRLLGPGSEQRLGRYCQSKEPKHQRQRAQPGAVVMLARGRDRPVVQAAGRDQEQSAEDDVGGEAKPTPQIVWPLGWPQPAWPTGATRPGSSSICTCGSSFASPSARLGFRKFSPTARRRWPTGPRPSAAGCALSSSRASSSRRSPIRSKRPAGRGGT